MPSSREAQDWVEWHRSYDDPNSRLSRRLRVVQDGLRRSLDARAGKLQIISMCAGQGLDVLPVLSAHPARDDVDALLVELDPRNAATARAGAQDAGLVCVRVRCADAALTDNYVGAAPADILLACGIFGNISDDDIRRTIEYASCLCAPKATVIWTRGRWRGGDVTPAIRRWFEECGFEEVSFDAPADTTFSVGVHCLIATPRPFERGVRMFRFFR